MLTTKRELKFKTRGGIPFTVPAGTKVEKNEKCWTGFYISPSVFEPYSIEHHDATYYGLAVTADDVQEVEMTKKEIQDEITRLDMMLGNTPGTWNIITKIEKLKGQLKILEGKAESK